MKERLLAAYAKHAGQVTRSCREVGMSRETFYDWKKNDPDFAERLEVVLEEEEARWVKVLDKNAKAGDSGAAMFMLKAINPERYDERVRLRKYEKERAATSTEEHGPIRIILERGSGVSRGGGADQES